MEMTGAQFLTRAFEAYGVTHFFHVPFIIPWTLAELDGASGVKRIVTHDERAAGYMADGYARASGRPALCGAQAIGTSNLAAGLRDAFMGCSPVIALSGGGYISSKHRHQYQEGDNLAIFEPVTKFNAHVEDVGRLPDLLRQAFRSAVSGTPGPVHLELEGHFGEVTETQVADLEPVFEPRFASVPPFRPEADARSVREALQLLGTAERPIIVAGGGVRDSGAAPELMAFAEQQSIPVATSLNAKDVILGTHPLAVGVVGLYQRECANRAVMEADLVCFIGSKSGSQVTRNWQVPRPGTTVIQIDIDVTALGRHYPNAVSLLGDAKVTLASLVAAGGDVVRDRSDWTARARDLVAEWRTEVAHKVDSEATPMRPERLCRELSSMLPSDAIVVADTGHAGFWTGTFLDLLHPGQGYLRAAGSLGWGFPAALGAKMAVGERPVVLFTGDGGLWYHLSEIETAVRWGVNIVVVVNDNRSMNEMIPFYEPMYGGQLHGRHRDLWVFENIDFAEVARSLHAEGLRVTNPREMAPALERALANDRLTVIDVVSDIAALCPWEGADVEPLVSEAYLQGGVA
jgi:acetolactate synthase I/II/III large subunit